MKNQFLFEMLAAFQIALEALYGKLTLHKMNAALSQLYIRDSLTGLYNRMAYQQAPQSLSSPAPSVPAIPAVFFLQMLISSRTSIIPLGTTVGSLAISTVASALRRRRPSTSLRRATEAMNLSV